MWSHSRHVDQYVYFTWLVKRFDKSAVYGPWMFAGIYGTYLEDNGTGRDQKARIVMRYRADGKRAVVDTEYAAY